MVTRYAYVLFCRPSELSRGEAPGQVTLSTTLTWALQLSQLPAR